MSLIGSLDEVKIADVLRLFSAGKKSGVLTAAHEGQQALLRFEKGQIVHAAAGRLQGDDAVIDLFGWKQGQLTFVPEERVVAPNVKRPVDALILEGLRVGETAHRMHGFLPNERVVFQLADPPEGAPAYPVTTTAWRVVRFVDGMRDVREIVEASRVPRSDVHRVLFELSEGGLVEKVELVKSLRLRAQPAGLFGKDAAEADERYEREWMRIARFAGGVHRIELRTLAGRTATLPVTFRAGLFRDVQVPRATLTEMGGREGEDVSARPVG
jgi:hypothetical protein